MIFAKLDFIPFVITLMIIVFCLIILHAFRYRSLLRVLITPKSRFLLVGFHPIKKALKYLCLSVGMALLCIALLRPQLEKEPLSVQEQGWNVVFALDVSRSMRSADIEPSRLTVAKSKIKSIVEQLSCSRLSLVLFSEDAFVQCPMTADKEAFFLFLEHVDSETISGGSTALDRALLVSIEAMKEVKNASKIIVLLTDGEDFSHDLASAKKQLQEQHIILCAIGTATAAGAPIPIIDQTGSIVGYEKDASGSVAISRLNESILSALTRDLGGLYVSVSSNNHEVGKIKQYITAQKKGLMDEKLITVKTDLYPWFLFAAMLFLFFEWFL
jgi:Ca-activated chloride channel homolog